MVAIRTPPDQRIYPLWNVQAFVNACSQTTGATNFGTYLGHSPTAERATDAFSQIPMPRSNMVVGDAIAEFTLANWARFGVRYIIWRQRINWNDGNGWRLMENRGNDTTNHFDHDHISFNVIPAGPTQPVPTAAIPGGKTMLIVNVKNTGIFLLRGNDVAHIQHPDHVLAWVKAGVPYQDKVEMSAEVFKSYTGWGQARGVMGGAGLDEGGDTEADAEAAKQYEETISGVRSGLDAIYDEYIKELSV